jgi:hypothetical protein
MLEFGSLGIVLIAVLQKQSACFVSVTKTHAAAQRRNDSRKEKLTTLRLPPRHCAAARVLFLFFIFYFLPGAALGNEQRFITITMLAPGVVRIDAQSLTPATAWSFRNAYAGVLGIADRVKDFRAITASEQDAKVRKLASGEFRSELEVRKISYTVNVSQPTAADVSHVSWIVGDHGLLMLADLLPQDFSSASVRFEFPPDWSVNSSNANVESNFYHVAAPEKSVFFVGRSLRKVSKTFDGMLLSTVVGGTLSFREKDALAVAGKVLKKYAELTGFKLPGDSFIMIAPLPVKVGSVKWRAETRGSTVVLLIDPAAGFRNWIGQLGVIFTHELLHLWAPNSLQLEGDYDWFFEGFTLYIALRTALELKLINFKEYLDTLARVYDSYLSYPDDVSLIDASERRWTTPGSFVYDKGMLVAFLYDLKVRRESAGAITLADRYRELFSGRVTANTEGNKAIISLLDSVPAMSGFARTLVESAVKLELEQTLPAYGLLLDSSGGTSQLRVAPKPGPEQSRLLKSLGFRK